MDTTAAHRRHWAISGSTAEFERGMAELDQPSLGLMLYGSQARGNPRIDSDIDLLQIVDNRPRAYTVGAANVAQYRPGTLLRMAKSGSLFIYHLKIEGRILRDPAGLLEQCLDAYVPPRDYSQMLSDIKFVARALDPRFANSERLVACGRLGIYLLRTTLYVRAIQRGIQTFDIDQILSMIGSDLERDVLGARHLSNGALDITLLELLHKSLSIELQDPLQNEFGSIDALAIATSNNPRVRSMMENLLAGKNSVDYTSLSLPPF